MFEHFKEMKDNGALLDPFKPKWYWEQMKGWSLQAYMVWMFGIGTIVFCLAYCIIGCVLVYFLAPKTFHIKN